MLRPVVCKEVLVHRVQRGDEFVRIVETREGGVDVGYLGLRRIRPEGEERGAPRERDPDAEVRTPFRTGLESRLEMDGRDRVGLATIQ